jgi:ACDE family multidrug resistance protein
MQKRAAPNRWVQLAALAGVPLMMVFGNSMLIPVLPDMGRQLGLAKGTTSLAVTAFSVAAGLGIALAGFLADRYGRKWVMIPALALYGIGGFISGLAGLLLGGRAFGLMMVGRVVQGLGAAGTAPIAMAFAGDLFKGPPRVTALGILEASNGLGKVLSPILGALIGSFFAWWMVCFVYSSFAIPILLLVLFLTKEPPREKAPAVRAYIGAIGQIFREKGKGLVACFWVGTIALTVLFGLLFFLSEQLEENYGIDGLPKGFWLMWPVLAMSLVSLSSGLILQKRPTWLKPAVIIGLSLELAGLILLSLIRAPWALLTGLIVVGLGTGLQLPGLNNLIISAAPSGQRGMVTSLYSAVRFFGVAFGPLFVGLLIRRSQALPFWISTGLVASALAAVLIGVNPEQLAADSSEQAGSEAAAKQNQPVGEDRSAGEIVEKLKRPAGIPIWRLPDDLPLGTRKKDPLR